MKNKAKVDRTNEEARFRIYGITSDDFKRMLEEQGGVCKLCKRPPSGRRLNIDHDHDTRRVRGLLCNICNMIMAFVDEDEAYVTRMEAYANVGS